MNTLRSMLGVFIVAIWFGCWAVALASMVLAARSRRPGAPRSGLQGPFDVMYRPSLLTPEGRRHRRRCFLAIGANRIGDIHNYREAAKL